MTLEITELIFNWINLRLISSKKVLATQGQNAGIICQMRLRQKKRRWDNYGKPMVAIFSKQVYLSIQ